MSRKHFGLAIAVAGLLTGSQIARADVEDGGQEKTEIFGYDGWALSGGPIWIWIVDFNKVADDNLAAAPNTLSFPAEKDPLSGYYVNIPQATRSTTIDNLPAADPIHFRSNFDKGNSNTIRALANETGRPSGTLTTRRQAPLTAPPQACARCAGKVVQTTAGPAESFAALFSNNFFRKGGSAVPRHTVAETARGKNVPLLVSLHRLMKFAQPFVARL